MALKFVYTTTAFSTSLTSQSVVISATRRRYAIATQCAFSNARDVNKFYEVVKILSDSLLSSRYLNLKIVVTFILKLNFFKVNKTKKKFK